MTDKRIIDLVEIDQSSLYSTPAGSPSSLTCPECGGAIWEINQEIRTFQCHINHTFSTESFIEGQAEEIEHLLWTLLRTLVDRVKLTQQLAKEADDNSQPAIKQQFEEQAQQALKRAELIQQVLLAGEA